MFCSSSAPMIFDGILPMTSCKVMLRLSAWSKFCFKNGFLTVRPVKSMVYSFLFLVSASQKTSKAPSSVTSLFFAMSKKVRPSFDPRASANVSKPLSLKAFRDKSRCLRVLLKGSISDKIAMPSLEIMLPPREISRTLVLFLSVSTSSGKPSSLILFCAKFR